MPPKRIQVEPRGRRAPKGFIGSTYDALTSPDNAAVVRSIAIFGLLGRDPSASPVNDAATIRDQEFGGRENSHE
ncbi:hypothetical protein LB504_006330 [Fusarium proliferatum]|nr:hypothetical protein LB504_006330 [Fusarium proliferatum]